jgi:hypothetical protein
MKKQVMVRMENGVIHEILSTTPGIEVIVVDDSGWSDMDEEQFMHYADNNELYKNTEGQLVTAIKYEPDVIKGNVLEGYKPISRDAFVAIMGESFTG